MGGGGALRELPGTLEVARSAPADAGTVTTIEQPPRGRALRCPTVTLRARLVLALVALTTVGLGVFGVVVFSLYARTQYQRVDAQLSASVTLASGLLTAQAGIDHSTKPSSGGPSQRLAGSDMADP